MTIHEGFCGEKWEKGGGKPKEYNLPKTSTRNIYQDIYPQHIPKHIPATMINFIRKELSKHFHKVTPLLAIQEELEEAELNKLKAESGCDYAHSLRDYHMARIKRLKIALKEIS